MKNADAQLRGLRIMAGTVTQDGKWMVKVGNSVKAFGLTESRAREWAKYYKSGVAVQG